MNAAQSDPAPTARPPEPEAGRDTPGLPVVLLHALPLDASMWEATARGLRTLGHHVLTPDQRGFGAAPPADGPPCLDAVADDLARYLDRRGIGRVALAGCSMGGYAAMAFLRRHPDRVAALALLAARAAADTPETAGQRLRFADLVLDDAVRPGLVAATAPALLGATTRARQPALAARVAELAQAARPESVAWAQRAVAARPDSTGTLRTADMPAVVVVGGEDELVSGDEARLTASALPQGRCVVLPGVGHLAPLEAPEATLQILSDLLTRTERAQTVAVPATAGAAGVRPC